MYKYMSYTAYIRRICKIKCNLHKTVNHQVHDPPAPPHEVIRAATWLSEKQLNLLAPSIMGKHPNSYTYSKRLAEALVREHYPELPVAVVRPSIGE